MFQMISVLFTLILIFAYLKFKEKAKRKYAGSIVFQIIDREYSNWYKKDRYGTVINKKTASMFEVDKVVFCLKEKLEVQGISKEQLKDYLDFLSSNEPKKIGIYSIILAVFGYFGSTKFLKGLLPDLNNINDVSTVFNNIANAFNKNKSIVLIVLYLLLFISILVLLSYTSYKIATMDTMYIDTQKIYVLKRAEKIWAFEKDDSVLTISDARDKFKVRNNLIFPELKSSKSKIEEDFDRAVGDTFNKNNEYFKTLPVIDMIKWQGIKEWLLGMSLPVIFVIIIFILCHLMVFFKDQLPDLLLYAVWFLTLFTIYSFMLIYITQIDKQNKLIDTAETNEEYSEQAESGLQTESSDTEQAESGLQTESSDTEQAELESQAEAKLKIKYRQCNNKRIYFSLFIILLVHYILCLILVNDSKKINLCSLNLIDNVSHLFKVQIPILFLRIPIIISVIVTLLSTFFQIEESDNNQDEN